jgi:putative NADPH-quinone reductase
VALGQSYARGAEVNGHHVNLYVTSKMTFDPVLHEGFERIQALEPELLAAHNAIKTADHLVFIYPLWLGTLLA